MITSADIVLWVYATVLSVFVAFVIIVRGQFRRFSVLATYFAIVAAMSLLRLHVLNAYGFKSPNMSISTTFRISCCAFSCTLSLQLFTGRCFLQRGLTCVCA